MTDVEHHQSAIIFSMTYINSNQSFIIAVPVLAQTQQPIARYAKLLI
jgi:hypothetical protein